MQKLKKRVSFDFDGTLDIPIIQEYAKSLIDRGVDVLICTYRFEPGYIHSWGGREWSNRDLFEVADKLGITEIIFTNMEDKWQMLDNDVIWHLDDDRFEIFDMNENSDIVGILVDEGWKEKCEKILFG